MEPTQQEVNTKRNYYSPRRREQARETREAIIEAARHLFLHEGFGSTTINAIASEVGVSVDTIYKGFGGKTGLVRAICEVALAGVGTVHAEDRSDALHGPDADPRDIIRGWGALTIEVAPRVAPILLLVRDAANTDPDMASLKAEVDQQRLGRMTKNAHRLAAGGHLRPGIDADTAGEILWTYSSPEFYELLAVVRGWTLERYGSFIADALIAALL
jgi:AcrR family transcriptional regulator